MHRPDHSSADADAIDTGKAGYTDGDPLALPNPIPPTKVVSTHMNDLGESLCVEVEGAGIVLEKGNYNQLMLAAQAYAALGIHCTWSAKTNDGSVTDAWGVAIWTGSEFIIAGENGTIQSSPDGHTWTAETPAGSHTQEFTGGCVHGTTLYLCTQTGSGGQVNQRPVAGGSWTLSDDAAADDWDNYAMASDGTDYLVVGEDETSGNVPFVRRNLGTPETNAAGVTSQRFVDVCVGDGDEFVVLGRTAASGYEVLKYVGGEWTVVASGAQTVDKIIWDPNFERYVLLGANATLTSPDGVTWTPRTGRFTTGTVAAVAFWRHVLYASTSTGQLQRSLDGGLTWTRIRHDATTSGSALAASDERLVMAGASGLVAASNRAVF